MHAGTSKTGVSEEGTPKVESSKAQQGEFSAEIVRKVIGIVMAADAAAVEMAEQAYSDRAVRMTIHISIF